tara:strand:+ start:15336 stop:15509 length:174 start_codon:yes stop_codon:yes gene_type:complete
MTKLFYRGFEVRPANDNVKTERHDDLVYRGTHYDKAVRKPANTDQRPSKMIYRGNAA